MSSMQPDASLITIRDNKKLIIEYIKDMILAPRQKTHKWSEITNQTPNLKMGYSGQHLASLITGMKGNATGARGDDIIDGSEVKSCSKVDQSDTCKKCKCTILRSYTVCPICGSTEIKRNNDSKWLISIKSDNELRMALEETPRFIFIVTDYPSFSENNFDDIRIRAFEIWVKSERCKRFRELLYNYYHYIYLEHIKKNPNKTPAPKNLWPDGYPFLMCNPIKTFECVIKDSLSDSPLIEITTYIEPDANRSNIPSEPLPLSLLEPEELDILVRKSIDIHNIEEIEEEIKKYLPLRDTDKKIKTIGTKKHKGNYSPNNH